MSRMYGSVRACLGRAVNVAASILAVTIAVVSTAAPPARATAAETPDLAAIVLGDVSGYEVAPPGVGLSGPLTAEQIAGVTPGADTATPKPKVTAGYGRTFETAQGRRATIVGFDLGTVGEASSFQAGVRDTAPDTGTVSAVAGLTNAFRIDVSPDRFAGISAQEVFLQSGRLVFVLVISDPTAPVAAADAIDLAQAQAAAVPAEISSQKDDENGLTGAAHTVGYVLGVMLPVGAIVLVVVLVRRRRR